MSDTRQNQPLLDTALIVLAREPAPGRVKSRLARDVSEDRAAALYRAFILDTLELCEGAAAGSRWIAHTPDEAGGIFAALSGPGWGLIPQGDGDLGDRLRRLFDQLFQHPYRRIIALGSDAPTLPSGIVKDAFRALEEKDVVVGPSLDGGYYLIGLSRPAPALLEGISWGTDAVLSQTVDRIERAGLSLAMLPPWYDVDTIIELNLLKAQLEGLRLSGETQLPRHTYALLQGMEMI
ncbi:MAG: TIGR04282 family arsenosugar biosynthesis glycosyltransferase [Planctomycetota bacterium]|nr:TIGR04282 family arsenosugar biosynthesis glycosyltransferase [Planctomycetota bacterium]